jgi:nitroreductase
MTTPTPETTAVATAAVDAAITSRMSTRAFTQQPVSREMLTDILQVASRAPSGTNTQPWKVYVLQGASRDDLVAKVVEVHDAMRANPALAAEYREEYDYYPEKWVSPYIDRRRENGWSLYGLLGIGKADKDRMHEQQQRNFRFFDAPVGLMFTVDKVMGRGSLVDYGMFMQNIMVAARARGLHTCPQAAWNGFAKIVLPHIGAGPDEMLVCGMSLGYADETDKVNTLHTPRQTVAEFTTWLA